MTRVKIAAEAEKDVDDIALGIAVNNLDAALRFYGAVSETYELIETYPGIGTRRMARNRRLTGLRSFGVIGFRNYLVFFRSEHIHVEIVRVLHGARDIDSIMGPR
jgi:toxin ParE1/3/4